MGLATPQTQGQLKPKLMDFTSLSFLADLMAEFGESCFFFYPL
jgi:hypothetical protein